MNSLKIRLVLGSFLLLLMFSAAMAFALNTVLNNYTTASQQNQLESVVYRILASLEVDDAGSISVNEHNLQIPALTQPDPTIKAIITSEKGDSLWQSTVNILPSTSSPQIGKWLFNNHKESYQVDFGFEWSTENNNNYRYSLTVISLSNQLIKQQKSFSKQLLIWLSGFSTLMLATFLIFLNWAMSPLQKIRSELSHIQAGDQHLLSGKFPDEIIPLSDTINDLIKHEKIQQQRYRNAVDDMAHSLKTPLAALQLNQQINANKQISEQLLQVNSIINRQLSRAAIGGQSQRLEPVNISSIVTRIVNSLQKVYASKNISYNNAIGSNETLHMDRADLFELLGNLLDNAAKFAQHNVNLRCDTTQTTITIWIEDDGPGIADSVKHNIVNRGMRADQKHAGQGIGLAMCSDILDVYMGSLMIKKSRLGGAKIGFSLPTHQSNK